MVLSTALFWLIFQHIVIFEHAEKTFEQSGAHKNDANRSTFKVVSCSQSQKA